MKHAKLPQLQHEITKIVRKSTLGDRLIDVRLEEGRDEFGLDFLRVILTVKSSDNLSWNVIKTVTREIEDSVARSDERFPSIRFAEAA